MNYRIIQRIALIILLMCIGFTTHFANELKLIREKSISVNPGEMLSVEASGADIKINSWTKNEAYVKIFGNRKAEDKMKFSIEKTSIGIKVTAKKESSWFFNWGSGYSVRIEIMLPNYFDTNIETSGGDIYIQNINGRFKLETSGGDIELKNTEGDLRVGTSGGDIKVDSHEGKTNVSTSGGDIIVKNLNGDLKSSTSGGDIQISLQNGSILAKTSGGDISIDYDGANKGIKASTSGGDIKLRLPSNFTASVELETTGGSIDSKFKNSSTQKVKRGLLIADFNGGGARVDCSTSGGDIDVIEK
ncbi:MAG: DUF4097 domain-containing protein [Ignavibacteria bacterium]|nr:DUF4097 domain-containing protein [Ignavibacteria bacterium]